MADYPEFETIKDWLAKGAEQKASHMLVAKRAKSDQYEPIYLDIKEGSAVDAYNDITSQLEYRVRGKWLSENEVGGLGPNKLLCSKREAILCEECYCLRSDAQVPLKDQVMEWRAFFFE